MPIKCSIIFNTTSNHQNYTNLRLLARKITLKIIFPCVPHFGSISRDSNYQYMYLPVGILAISISHPTLPWLQINKLGIYPLSAYK